MTLFKPSESITDTAWGHGEDRLSRTSFFVEDWRWSPEFDLLHQVIRGGRNAGLTIDIDARARWFTARVTVYVTGRPAEVRRFLDLVGYLFGEAR